MKKNQTSSRGLGALLLIVITLLVFSAPKISTAQEVKLMESSSPSFSTDFSGSATLMNFNGCVYATYLSQLTSGKTHLVIEKVNPQKEPFVDITLGSLPNYYYGYQTFVQGEHLYAVVFFEDTSRLIHLSKTGAILDDYALNIPIGPSSFYLDADFMYAAQVTNASIDNATHTPLIVRYNLATHQVDSTLYSNLSVGTDGIYFSIVYAAEGTVSMAIQRHSSQTNQKFPLQLIKVSGSAVVSSKNFEIENFSLVKSIRFLDNKFFLKAYAGASTALTYLSIQDTTITVVSNPTLLALGDGTEIQGLSDGNVWALGKSGTEIRLLCINPKGETTLSKKITQVGSQSAIIPSLTETNDGSICVYYPIFEGSTISDTFSVFARTPFAPVLTDAQGHPTYAMIAWDAPLKTGGMPLTGYQLSYKKNGDPVWVTTDLPISPVSRDILLDQGSYSFFISAINEIGIGSESNILSTSVGSTGFAEVSGDIVPLLIYPNPVISGGTISLEQNIDPLTVKIYTFTGQECPLLVDGGALRITVPPGMYFVSSTNAEHVRYSKLIVK